MHFLGAGIWGAMHTWESVNFWTHGTQITPSHGYFAFFGAFAMTVIAFIYYAMPRRIGLDRFRQARGFWSVWAMNPWMILMVMAMLVAGIIQIYISRVLGEGYVAAQTYLHPCYALRWVGGWIFAIGVLAYAWDFASLLAPARAEEKAAPRRAAQPSPE